jgi:hypothetical protein
MRRDERENGREAYKAKSVCEPSVSAEMPVLPSRLPSLISPVILFSQQDFRVGTNARTLRGG